MHPDQLAVSIDVVRRLVDEQFPAWREMPIRPVNSDGTVNALFRIGEHLVARFPLEDDDIAATRERLEREASAARELFGRTPFPTPTPVAVGKPGAGYPLPWSVQTWLPGTVATRADPGHSVAFAHDLAAFIRSVRDMDTLGRTFSGDGRGGDLRSHDSSVAAWLARSEGLIEADRIRLIWAELRDVPRNGTPDRMTHGDLIPGNVLVTGARLAGVIDVGGLGPADPALDLVAAWHLLEDGPRHVLREDLGCDDAEWMRGKAWALVQAVGVLPYYVRSNPTMSRMGHRTLSRIMRVRSDD